MDIDLVHRIVDDALGRYSQIIGDNQGFHLGLYPEFFSEPLLPNRWNGAPHDFRKMLLEFIGYVDARSKGLSGRKIEVQLITNGDFLKIPDYHEVVDPFENVDISFCITNHDLVVPKSELEHYWQNPRETVKPHILELFDHLREHTRLGSMFHKVLREGVVLYQPVLDDFAEGLRERYVERLRKMAWMHEICNRMGMVDYPPAQEHPLFCDGSMGMSMLVLHDGKVAGCAHDILAKRQIGDLTVDTIEQIWTRDSERRRKLREQWSKSPDGRKFDDSWCHECNYGKNPNVEPE
jgi:radical SAM protein with 4Fe4S-binding SPASM domain